jgi:alkaline phosphatase
MRRPLLILAALLIACQFSAGAYAAKNIILMIGDGMGPDHIKAGSYYLTGAAGNLCFEPYYKCSVTTRSLNSSITDSAAAATAMATGHKTNNGIISQSPTGTQYQTILELAKTQGKRTGLVTVDPITGATPAGFGAHEPSRNNYINIGNDYLNSAQPEVIFGGGDPARGGSSYFNSTQVTAAQSQG